MAEPRSGESGVTLIEVLVVLTLIAVSAGVVTLALPRGASERSLTQEAELLASRLNLAAERSLVEGRHLRFGWKDGAYSFEEWSDDDWQATADATLSTAAVLGEDTALADQQGARSGSLVITPDLLPPEGGALELILASGATRRTVVFDGLEARLDGSAP